MTRSPASPKRVGKYRVIAELGSGGMGIVYLAQSRPGERVALKVIRPDLARNAEFRRRFAREAKAASAISGACIARVIDSDTEGRTPFIATEFVDGPTLDAFVARHGALEGEQLRAFALALAEALGAIHRGGLIHRDLKPTNILLTPTGPKVIDFGVAKAAQETSLTGTGLMLGTPAWMAPEQAKGERATEAADVFAWGCLVSYAATGVPPFGYGSAEAMLYRVVHEEPNLSDLPGDVAVTIRATLAKAPTERPTVAQIVATFLADDTLTNVDRTVSMRVADTIAQTWHVPDSFERPLSRDRKPALVAAVCVMAAAVLALVGAAVWDGMKAPNLAPNEAKERPRPSESPSSLPRARNVSVSSLLRPATTEEKVAYLEMDGRVPEEIAVVSTEHRGDPFSQRYLDVFTWNDDEWQPILDATSYTPPGAKDTVLPFGTPRNFGGRDVNFLKRVDFFGDGTDELVAGITSYGASSGPMQTFVFSQVGDRVRTDFTHETERGGELSHEGDTIALVTGEYLPSDAMCCPSFELRAVIGAAGGEIRYLESKSEPTEYYVPPLEEASLSITSLGPLRIGMTLAEAEDSSGKQFSVGYDNGSCAYATPINGPRGISIMFLDGRLARIDVDEGDTTTLSGIGIGSAEDEVYAAYPGRIRDEPHPYEGDFGWNYLIFSPQDASDQAYSMIFSTDGKRVLDFRAGEKEAVSFIEGCL